MHVFDSHTTGGICLRLRVLAYCICCALLSVVESSSTVSTMSSIESYYAVYRIVLCSHYTHSVYPLVASVSNFYHLINFDTVKVKRLYTLLQNVLPSKRPCSSRLSSSF
jgi:hypothetical protein